MLVVRKERNEPASASSGAITVSFHQGSDRVFQQKRTYFLEGGLLLALSFDISYVLLDKAHNMRQM